MSQVYPIFAQRGLAEKIVWVGAGRLGFPAAALFGFALGCDMIAVAREAMLAIGCIQAQKCETGHCPTGVATQNKWLVRGLDPESKADRLANYMITLRKEIMWLTRACGLIHPSLVTMDQMTIVDECFKLLSLRDLFGYERYWELPSLDDQTANHDLMTTGTSTTSG